MISERRRIQTPSCTAPSTSQEERLLGLRRWYCLAPSDLARRTLARPQALVLLGRPRTSQEERLLGLRRWWGGARSGEPRTSPVRADGLAGSAARTLGPASGWHCLTASPAPSAGGRIVATVTLGTFVAGAVAIAAIRAIGGLRIRAGEAGRPQ